MTHRVLKEFTREVPTTRERKTWKPGDMITPTAAELSAFVGFFTACADDEPDGRLVAEMDRAEVRAELDGLGMQYPSNAGVGALRAMLEQARQERQQEPQQ